MRASYGEAHCGRNYIANDTAQTKGEASAEIPSSNDQASPTDVMTDPLEDAENSAKKFGTSTENYEIFWSPELGPQRSPKTVLTKYAISGIFERYDETTDLCCRLTPALLEFPKAVQQQVGFALYQAQMGGKHLEAKPLKNVGAGVPEVVSDHRGDTFRTVYTVKLEKAVYVLHAFQKKSKHGIATPKSVIDLVRQRLQRAIEIDREREK